MPPEWAPQTATWLSWPTADPRHWNGEKTAIIHGKFAEIAATISRFQIVRINAPATRHRAIRSACASRPRQPPEYRTLQSPQQRCLVPRPRPHLRQKPRHLRNRRHQLEIQRMGWKIRALGPRQLHPGKNRLQPLPTPLRLPAHTRGRRHRGQRPRPAAHHRGRPPQSQPQPEPRTPTP